MGHQETRTGRDFEIFDFTVMLAVTEVGSIRKASQLSSIGQAVGVAQDAGAASKGHLNVGLIASLSRDVIRELAVDFVACHPKVDLSVVEAQRGGLLSLLSHRRLDATTVSYWRANRSTSHCRQTILRHLNRECRGMSCEQNALSSVRVSRAKTWP